MLPNSGYLAGIWARADLEYWGVESTGWLVQGLNDVIALEADPLDDATNGALNALKASIAFATFRSVGSYLGEACPRWHRYG